MELTLRKNKRREELFLTNEMERTFKNQFFGGSIWPFSEKECSDFLNSVILVIFIIEENKEPENRKYLVKVNILF